MLTEKGKITRYVWVFMALYILNLSVDSPYTSSLQTGATVYNEQESIIELVIEKFLGYEDAIPEQADDDGEDDQNCKKPVQAQFLIESQKVDLSICLIYRSSKTVNTVKNLKPSDFIEIDAPPPKV